jgi:spore coat polysaccharide biosynthesis protein SpsF
MTEFDETSVARSEADRLERLWAGEFGDEYVDRNRNVGQARGAFWDGILRATDPASVLEVGCNIGENLRWLIQPGRRVAGIDVNRRALGVLRAALPQVDAREAPARSLPFDDGAFDLTFTMGVLIHQPEETLGPVMDEMVRCSRHWVLVGEYYGAVTEEVPYRGVDGALFRRDYGTLFLNRFGSLRLEQSGFLGRADGWDDVSWWLFRTTEQ